MLYGAFAMVNMAMLVRWDNFYPIREICNKITLYCDKIIGTISHHLFNT
jgi:hypothetical protein